MLLTPQCVSQCVVFGDFRFNVPTRELLRIGSHGSAIPVALGSRAADLLHLFLDRPGQLITKREIMDAVWPNMAVEESNLTVQISALRRALGGGRNGTRYIQTVPGRGYRFTPWVDEFAARIEDAGAERTKSVNGAGADALPVAATAPSRDRAGAAAEIAVLPPAMVPAGPGAAVAAACVPPANIWWLSWLNGVAGVILGLMLITAPGITTAALVSFLGFYWLIMGMLALVRVFVDRSVPWVWPLIIGVAGIAAGVLVVRHLLVAALITPTAIVAALAAQSLVVGGIEIATGVIGAGAASFILGAVYLLVGLLLLGSLAAAALAIPPAFGALFLVQGAALTLVAFRVRS